jgi:hypothetical protein
MILTFLAPEGLKPSFACKIQVLIAFATNTAAADQITLEIASADAGATYHRIFLREQGQAYDYSNWAYQGSETTVTIDNLQAGVAYYFVARSYSDSHHSEDSNEVTFTGPMGQAPVNPIQVWLEAEDGDITDPMQIIAGDADCSGDFVLAPNGSGNHWDSADSFAGEAVYSFEVPVAGDYTIWGRIMSPTDNDNSLWVSVDGGPFALWDTEISGVWMWDATNSRDIADPAIFTLSAGSHTLTVKTREDGTGLDKLVITNDPSFIE